jgi:hypothetical protein
MALLNFSLIRKNRFLQKEKDRRRRKRKKWKRVKICHLDMTKEGSPKWWSEGNIIHSDFFHTSISFFSSSDILSTCVIYSSTLSFWVYPPTPLILSDFQKKKRLQNRTQNSLILYTLTIRKKKMAAAAASISADETRTPVLLRLGNRAIVWIALFEFKKTQTIN